MSEAWIPRGMVFPDQSQAEALEDAGSQWQIWSTNYGGRVLIAEPVLWESWLKTGLLTDEVKECYSVILEGKAFWVICTKPASILSRLANVPAPESLSDALTFARSLKETRELSKEIPLQNSLYVEELLRLLPTYENIGSSSVTDAQILGSYLTGGVPVSPAALSRMQALAPWISKDHLGKVLQESGTALEGVLVSNPSTVEASKRQNTKAGPFKLPGRPELEAFFLEHVLDVIENEAQYAALGVGFPSAMVLHGPPGCGKTFAVERLVEHLGWPEFRIEATSVASPYIHETSKKIAEVFEAAASHSPSVLIIDEMDAFLTDRAGGGTGGHQHHIEEVAEFLRRIPEAVSKKVLIFGMTNRLDLIDPAILRRGRFDHIIEVSWPSAIEIEALLKHLLKNLPKTEDLDIAEAIRSLDRRPLADAAFVIREAARLAAKNGKQVLDQESLNEALAKTSKRESGPPKTRPIGFVWGDTEK